ncbi:hypothetical protein BDR26DRAFT_69662 [Obelidium mucronatum]|nr:hypothetical protein BDR26DRAFT_69662 [Obelidium mucronatum]
MESNHSMTTCLSRLLRLPFANKRKLLKLRLLSRRAMKLLKLSSSIVKRSRLLFLKRTLTFEGPLKQGMTAALHLLFLFLNLFFVPNLPYCYYSLLLFPSSWNLIILTLSLYYFILMN